MYNVHSTHVPYNAFIWPEQYYEIFLNFFIVLFTEIFLCEKKNQHVLPTEVQSQPIG